MPRFVILHHDHPRGIHWDLMLEDGPILATWELPRMPEIGAEFEVRRLFDHGIHFLEYEGPLSADRGRVVRVAQGEFQTVLRTESRWVVLLHSESFECQVELVCSDREHVTCYCRVSRVPDD